MQRKMSDGSAGSAGGDMLLLRPAGEQRLLIRGGCGTDHARGHELHRLGAGREGITQCAIE